MIKLVLTDIDGTLMNSHGEVSEKNVEAITRLKERGFLFGVASGRNHKDLEKNFPEPLSAALDVVVGENGYRVMDYSDHTQLLGKKINQPRVKEIMDFFKDIESTVFAIDEKGIYTASYTKLMDEFIEVTHSPWQYTRLSDEEFAQMPMSKMTYFVYDQDVPAFRKRMQQLPYQDILGVQTGYNCFEFQDISTTKAHGIELYIQKHHIRKEEVCAMGDGENDLAMIQYVGLGIAMKNGNPKLKAAADRVSDYTCDEDGVAHILDHL